jgi:hypothetical protein
LKTVPPPIMPTLITGSLKESSPGASAGSGMSYIAVMAFATALAGLGAPRLSIVWAPGEV